MRIDSMSDGGSVSLKEHLAAIRAVEALMAQLLRDSAELLRAAQQRHADKESDWIKEKFVLHNNLLEKWQTSSERDRGNFVSADSFEALKTAFDLYKEVTAKSLTLAEGKAKGIDVVRTGVSFVAGIVIAALASWAALKGFR